MKIENVKEIKQLNDVVINGEIAKHRYVTGSNGLFSVIILPGKPSLVFGQDYLLEGEEGGYWVQM